MAVIGKIRQYSGIAIIAIALSTLAFILTDLIGPGGSGFFGGGQDQTIGTIDGKSIKDKEFNNEVATLEAQNPGQAGEQFKQQVRQQAWNNFIFRMAYQKEFEKLGLTVTNEELEQMVQGDSIFIHPQIKNVPIFKDSTGKFDKSLVITYLQYIGNDKTPKIEKVRWQMFEDNLAKARLREKYENLFRVSSYITKAEAKRAYENQTTKAEVEYLYVPFTSIADSTLEKEVTDEKLKAYLKKYPDKYKAQETRSLSYVAFDIKPSKEDSAAFSKNINQMARDFAKVENDSSYAITQSETPPNFNYVDISQVPTVLFDKVPTILEGGVYGPLLDGKSYKIFKVIDVKEDSTKEFVRARHILVKVDKNADEETKQKARERINEALAKIKDGEDFAKVAKEYGEDGTKEKGGDLGFFGKGRMVKPFEEAVFARENMGLIPNIVETDFGYHIIDVTYPKTSNTYKLATIEQTLNPSEATRNIAFRKAQDLRAEAETAEELKAKIEKNPKLVLLEAPNLQTTAQNIGAIQKARNVVLWAFKDAQIGDVSKVFDIPEQNQYVIATLTKKTEKDESTIDAFREQLKAEVLKEIKAEKIIKKLGKGKDLKAMAKKYGTDAVLSTATDISLSANTMQNAGFNPTAIGTAFGLKKGQKTKPFKDENGVFVLKLNKIEEAPEIAEYTQYKNNLQQQLIQRVSYYVNEAIVEGYDVEDRRYKFF